MERALLVTIRLKRDQGDWPIEDVALELEQLVYTAEAEVVDNIITVIEAPKANFFIGSGKTEEIALICQELAVDTVIFSCDLSGTQQRNLEEVIGKKTIDRTQLILDIFARHAKSPEGKMQVELAQLEYLLPRLVGKGIMLSRLGGGIGTRGPGEQKLEVDRRQLRKRIDKLGSELKHLILHRQTIKKKRKESAIASIALVGYTNAGKSTLMNALTQSAQKESDGLFTTLDTLTRNLILGNGENVIISDTVGFLNNLPHHLVESFRATLEEAMEADLLIHVLDAAHPRVYEHNSAVREVLKKLNADKKPMITVLNKTDLLTDKLWLDKLKSDFTGSIALSAKTKENLSVLISGVEDHFKDRMVSFETLLMHSQMALVDLFHRQGKVEKASYLQKGIKIKATIPKALYQKLKHNFSKIHLT